MKHTLARLAAIAFTLPAAAGFVACDSGGDPEGAVTQASPPAAATRAPRAATAAPSAIAVTPAAVVTAATRPAPTRPPASSGGAPIAFSPGTTLLDSDLAARGVGEPGRGTFNIARIVLVAGGVDAAVTSAVVGSDGRMPDPPSLDVVVWYDFAMWPGLGGLPGAGGNIVLAGDAYKPDGNGVFAGRAPDPGAFIRLVLNDGSTLCYRIEFKKSTAPQQFDALVQATAEESVTVITGGIGDNRTILWGRRAACAAEPAATATPAPPAGHHKLKIVAEGLAFTIVEGGTVPLGTHTVDFNVDHRDAGVEHTIAFYETSGRELISSEPVLGPQVAWGGAFGVGPPQPPGEYTFRCSIHPQMSGAITVLP